MKQPELGRKISELRTAKGWTQEELVEKCNISVRTIQRIEAGEVTPRSYTIRTILEALDYDFSKVSTGEKSTEGSDISFLKKIIPGEELLNNHEYLKRHLNYSWAFGIAYFVFGFLEAGAEYFRFSEGEMVFGKAGYVAIKLCVLVAYLFFQRGFVLIGSLYNNYLLRVISLLLIGAVILLTAYDIASVFYDSNERKFVLSGISMCFGAMGIVYGVALRRLEKPLGRIAELAGITELIVACCFLTIIFSFVGFIFQIPAELFEIILIFKVLEQLKYTQINQASSPETLGV